MIGTVYVAASTPTPTPAQPLNISTRMEVRTDDQVLIGGFIITGNDPKKVILRAIGPSLAGFGIANPLADPVLELHASDGSLITMNDNWKDTQQAEIEASGFQPQNDLESAIISTLDPGSYTAVVSGKDGGTGVGLVEGYDLDQAADSQFGNISTRGFVETGTNVMIGGFILGGESGNANVVVRALGPSLTAFGVTGALADPTLELRDKTEPSSRATITGKRPSRRRSKRLTCNRRTTWSPRCSRRSHRAPIPRLSLAKAISPGWVWWRFIGFSDPLSAWRGGRPNVVPSEGLMLCGRHRRVDVGENVLIGRARLFSVEPSGCHCARAWPFLRSRRPGQSHAGVIRREWRPAAQE